MAAKKKGSKLTSAERDYLKFNTAWLDTEETVLAQIDAQIAFNRNEIEQHRKMVKHRREMRALQISMIAKVRKDFVAWKRKVGRP